MEVITVIKKLLVLGILILALLAVPVNAKIVITGNYAGWGSGTSSMQQGIDVSAFQYSAPADEGISMIRFDLPISTEVDYTITYGTGNTVSGFMSYYPNGSIGLSTSTISLGGDSRSEDFIDAQALGYSLTRHVQFSSYGFDDTTNQTGFALYADGYPTWSEEVLFYPVSGGTASNMITGVSVTSTGPITVYASHVKKDLLGQTLTASFEQRMSEVGGGLSADVKKWVDFAYQVGLTLWGIANAILYWGKFFLWDNLVMTIALYIGITGAIAFNQSKDVFAAIKKFFAYQRSLYAFILATWAYLVQMIAEFRGIFRI